MVLLSVVADALPPDDDLAQSGSSTILWVLGAIIVATIVLGAFALLHRSRR